MNYIINYYDLIINLKYGHMVDLPVSHFCYYYSIVESEMELQYRDDQEAAGIAAIWAFVRNCAGYVDLAGKIW